MLGSWIDLTLMTQNAEKIWGYLDNRSGMYDGHGLLPLFLQEEAMHSIESEQRRGVLGCQKPNQIKFNQGTDIVASNVDNLDRDGSLGRVRV